MTNPYRDSEVVTGKAPTYTWSFKLGFIDVMKPDSRDNLTESGWAATLTYWAGLIGMLIFGCVMSKNIIQFGLGVPWVKRELIVWCCIMAFWFMAFIRPYISKTQD